MAFQKYQSEQVQEIAPGFVEAFAKSGAAIGQGIQQAGSSIAHGMEVNTQKKQEEAKMQGMLAPYLKTDQRVQSVKQQLATGWMKVDNNGNVYIPDEHKDKFDPSKAADAIDFYNQTGGDGSKLTGPALTKFATSFEAEKKYASEQAALEDKRIEKLKTLAEIRKMEAEAAEKYGKLGRSEIIGAFGSGADMSTYQPDVAGVGFRSVLDGTPYANGGASLANRGSIQPPASSTILSNTAPVGVFNTDLTGRSFSLTPESGPALAAPSGFTPERYQAGAPVAATLKRAVASPTISTPPVVAGTPAKIAPAGSNLKPAPAPGAVTAPMNLQATTAGASTAYLAEIPKLQAARTQLDAAWQSDITNFSTNYNLALSRLTASGGTTEEIKALGETFANQYKLKSERYQANVASIADRLKAFESSANETRAAQTSGIALNEEARKQLAESVEYGTPIKPGKVAPASDSKDTFANTLQSRIENAGNIEGRTGGTKSADMQMAAVKKHEGIMKEHPSWWNIGLTTPGAIQYQLDLRSYPSASGVDPGVRPKLEEEVQGYNEGRVFLTQMLAVVNSTDEDAIKNYLDRFLLTTSKEITQAQGELLSQFGVAAFRKAIVAGGNFSDADRIYVEKMITDINSPNMMRNKDKQLAKTKVLAEFIDSRFRAGFASKNVRVDLDSSEKFLKREGDTIGLSELAKAREFYTAYKIDPNAKSTVSNPGGSNTDISSLRTRAEAARKAGNDALAKRFESEIEKLQKAKEDAARKATADAAKTRGK